MISIYSKYGGFPYVKRIARAFCGYLYSEPPLKNNLKEQHSNLCIFENNQRKFLSYLMGGPNLLENQHVSKFHFAVGLQPVNAILAERMFDETLRSTPIVVQKSNLEAVAL